MGKLLTAVLAIAALAGASWYALDARESGAAATSSEGPSAPKRQLDNVREAAGRIETDADQRSQQMEGQLAQ